MADTTLLSQLLGDIEGKLSIHQCERIAKELVHDGIRPEQITFELVGPNGRKRCSWLDPHLGFFQIEGLADFVQVSRIEMYHGLHVENLDTAAQPGGDDGS